MPQTPEEIQARLATERNIWLASVRPNGSPHLVPIWFVSQGGLIYICTDPESVKVRNLQHNGRVSLALEDGSKPIIFEGSARVVPHEKTPAGIIPLFKQKYDWDITTDEKYSLVIEVTPRKTMTW
jgi:F420H(2)-dependent biliverdin reductase